MKITQAQFISEVTNSGYYAIIGTPYKSVQTEEEQNATFSKWLELSKICHRELAKKDYGTFSKQGNKLVRIVDGNRSVLSLYGFTVYKYADRYILAKKQYDSYCGYYIKFIIYHRVNTL